MEHKQHTDIVDIIIETIDENIPQIEDDNDTKTAEFQS